MIKACTLLSSLWLYEYVDLRRSHGKHTRIVGLPFFVPQPPPDCRMSMWYAFPSIKLIEDFSVAGNQCDRVRIDDDIDWIPCPRWTTCPDDRHCALERPTLAMNFCGGDMP